VNSRDFLKNKVHPAISNWTRQASEHVFMMFTLVLVRNNVSLRFQNDEHLDEVLEWIDSEIRKYTCGVAICIRFQRYWIAVDGQDPHSPQTYSFASFDSTGGR
jgi:uncharacterized protein YacL (UPF0231 family)